MNEEEYIAMMLILNGMNRQLKGFEYMVSAVEYRVANKQCDIERELYPAIAKKYNVSVTKLKRKLHRALKDYRNKGELPDTAVIAAVQEAYVFRCFRGLPPY